ncbi:LacI family DNA-binding transcriptional regulator, partial [Candidatus Aerophobetes bacterium]|nr:LacI family DNA-binding transcriptional regulator [Candidatus Aerophobetes bacterium]
ALVSLALNQKPYVSKEARERIYKAIQELGYRPNIVARSLRKKRTGIIGLVLSDIANPFFPEIARGVEERAREYGFNVIFCNTDANPEREKNLINILLSRQIDGLIITSARSNANLQEYLKENCPIVLVNRDPFPGKFDFVGIDNVNAAKIATEHLISLGHRKIAFIEGEPASPASFGRYEGYKKALLEANIPLREDYVRIGYLRYEGGYRAMLSFLENPSPPTAVFCANDMMAIGAIDACLERGFRVPEDFAIVGFDDMWVASLKSIELTTVRQPRYEMGVRAVDLMIERIEGKRSKIKREILPAELIIRKTCGKFLKEVK